MCRKNGYWTFCQHQSDLHKPRSGIQASDDTYAWDINRTGPSGEFNTDKDAAVFAVDAGTVVKYGSSVPPGTDACNSVLVKHSTNGVTWWSGYLHLASVAVFEGQEVVSGTRVER